VQNEIDMKKILFIQSMVFTLVVLLSLSACWRTQDAKKGLLVVNVLDKELYQDCHIKGSTNIPFDRIDEYITKLDKSAEIVLYCTNYMCTTSDYVAKKLRDHGFDRVMVYEAGMAEWYQKGLPVEGPATSGYLAKRVEPENTAGDVPVITTDELAHKMGYQIPAPINDVAA
jgi:rhodanese-related sulfurtransferase